MAEVSDDPVAKARLETREYVWKHWAFHADQRLRAFHFFILIVTVILAGLLTYLKDARYPAFVAPACVFVPVLSWIFWRLDCRSRAFIHHAEEILKEIEGAISEELVPLDRRLITQMERKSHAVWQANYDKSPFNPSRWWQAPLGFYHSFAAVFIAFGVLGLGLGIASLLLPNQHPPDAPAPPQQNFYIGTQSVAPVPGKPP